MIERQIQSSNKSKDGPIEIEFDSLDEENAMGVN